MTVDERLADLRRRIDQLDDALVRLLNARSACALEIGALKHQAGLPVYQPDREQEVLRQARAANPGPLDEAAVTRLFERIIDEARRLERKAMAESAGRDTMDVHTSKLTGNHAAGDRPGRIDEG